ncbi:bifunctional metallophosphatase/5'-nucleotidase [Deinococcus yavapaiensis]|uniref:5'-nucleotidase n=1 Tax=Deinococcus yavapaiensis KR-236 TaxID=694435 RepID=A0A318SB58_9DEIO|nr:bifunctional metallophosphatase/5'-nucleotidase [Deinococcus yavapaiensis]PYE56619.1 5'-nucleotidase [Deinococcus yavapaiensis KR-236]
MKNFSRIATLTTLTLLLAACNQATQVGNKPPQPVDVTVLGLNDFHGNLEPTTFTPIGAAAAIKAGGIEAIGGELADARAANKNTIFVGGGDLIGASPVTSSLLRDEPTVYALSELGMKASALGNHEFDQGLQELLRMQNGGCASNDANKACKFDPNYSGATFKWLGANVEYKANGANPFTPYYVETTADGARIGFIGAVTTETPTIVSPSGIAEINFLDEAESINKYVPVLKSMNVDAIVVLIHEGGTLGTNSPDTYATEGCKTLNTASPIYKIARKVDPSVVAIISGHTHTGYNCLVPDPNGKDRIVIQGEFYGHLLQRLDLTVDKANHRVVSAKAANLVVNYDQRAANNTLDFNMTQLLTTAKAKTDAVKNVFVTNLSVPQIRRGFNATKADDVRDVESALGDVIADAQVFATQDQGTQFALMNPGGIRGNLPGSPSTNGGARLTFGDVFAVQPFSNTMVVMDLTGAQVKAALELIATGANATANKVLQVSEGFSYTIDLRPGITGPRVSNVTFQGQPLGDTTTYRVAMNSFLADGGDAFTPFKQGTNRVLLPGLQDVDALVAYLKAKGSTLDGQIKNRITIIR